MHELDAWGTNAAKVPQVWCVLIVERHFPTPGKARCPHSVGSTARLADWAALGTSARLRPSGSHLAANAELPLATGPLVRGTLARDGDYAPSALVYLPRQGPGRMFAMKTPVSPTSPGRACTVAATNPLFDVARPWYSPTHQRGKS